MSEGAKIASMPCGKSLPRTDSAGGSNDSKIDQYNFENVQRVAFGARVLEKPLHKSLRERESESDFSINVRLFFALRNPYVRLKNLPTAQQRIRHDRRKEPVIHRHHRLYRFNRGVIVLKSKQVRLYFLQRSDTWCFDHDNTRLTVRPNNFTEELSLVRK